MKQTHVLSHFDEDIKIQLHLSDFIQQHIYFLGYYDRGLQQWIGQTLKTGDVYVDVGANVGCYTLLAAKRVGATGKVYAFEPVSHTADRLEQNIGLNHFTNIQVVRKALYQENTELTFFLSSDDNVGMSSIHRHDAESGQTEVIQAIKADDFFNQEALSRIDLIKIDIEGAEWFALQGMKETLLKYHPLVVLEFSDELLSKSGIAPQQLISFFTDLGYTLHQLTEDGVLIPADLNALGTFENVVFKRLS
ncbi:MAG: FkbM family methyltransferase [Chitinophagaceae bacterium]|nr:FkbM family methyltransferase [Chitinophagaceae bacterium]